MITLRSLVVGLVCGSILCCTNMYFGLQTGVLDPPRLTTTAKPHLTGPSVHAVCSGWVTMGSLQSALLGFGFFKMLQSRGLGLGFDAAENVIVQTTAVATATMPLSAGFVGIVPAFGQLSVEENPPIGGFTLGAWQLLAWSAALAFFGVFFAVPLREQVIIREKLPFPSGTATAKIISILHNHPLGKEDEEDEEGSRPEILSVAEEEEPSTQGDAEASTRVSREMPHADCASPFCALAHSPGAPFSTPPAAVPGLLATMSSPLPRNETTRGSTLLRGLSLPSEAHSAFMPLLDQVHSGFPVAALEQLEEDRTQWGRTWATLMWSIGITMTLTFLTNLVPGLGRFPLFDWMGFKVASAWGWEILPSFGYVGQGMIMGKRTTLSMLAGAVVGYIVLGPYVRRKGWAPGPIQDWGTGATGWCLWISLAIMLGDSLTSLGMLGCSYAYSALAGSFRRRAMDGGYEALAHSGSPDSRSSREAREPRGCKKIPVSWWGGGLLCSSALCAAVLIPMFGMAFWEPILAVLLSFVVGVLAVRALGETDLNPVSGVGKLSQIVFGIVSPGNVVANLVAGAVAEAGASQAGDIMQDFKTAHLCGRSAPSTKPSLVRLCVCGGGGRGKRRACTGP